MRLAEQVVSTEKRLMFKNVGFKVQGKAQIQMVNFIFDI
jgi:hypothetical protein